MTTGAYLFPTRESFRLPTVAPQVGAAPLPIGSRGLLVPVALDDGAFTNTQPVSELPQALPGDYVWSFFDDFYNRVYLLPSTMDFGAVAGVMRQTVYIWNAFMRPIDLLAILASSADGVSISGPPVPGTIKALMLRGYQITVTTEGPPDLNAIFTFQFDVVPDGPGGEISLTLHVVGQRSRLWPFMPNWREPYLVSYEFKSEITVSRSKREQRRALRQTPRKSLEFTAVARRSQLRTFNRLMDAWQSRMMIVPESTRWARALAGMAAGSTTMQLAIVPPWLRPGLSVALVFGQAIELRIVDEIEGSSVVFQSAGTLDWPAGTKVHPALRGTLSNTLDVPRLTNDLAEFKVRFDILPGSEDAEDPGAPAATFDGRELFLDRPNWAEEVAFTHMVATESVDFGIGVIGLFYPSELATRLFRATWLQRNPDAAETLLRFFTRMAGQVGEFYMPTWESDIVLKVPLVTGSTEMRIAGTDVAHDYADDLSRRALMLVLRDGTRLFRKINVIRTIDDIDGLDTIIEVTETWPYGIALADVSMISWLHVCRHAGDSFTIQWTTDQVAQAQLSIQTLEALPAEPVTPT